MHLSGTELALVMASVVAGSMVQGAIGFGVNLVAVPVMALVEPEALPATLIILALPLAGVMLAREHHHVDRRGVLWVSLGRVPGTAVGVWIVTLLSDDALSVVIGTLVILAAASSSLSPEVAITPVSAGATGFASGVMGTASSIGGPPVALLYQHQSGTVLRSTTAAIFLIGITLSTTALAVAGEVAWWQVGLAAVLMPGVVAGLALARALHDRLEGRWLRPAVLAFVTVAGAVTVARGLL